MRELLFRCDTCHKLYPLEFKKAVHIQPIPATTVAADVAVSQGRPMMVNLLDTYCSKCYDGLVSMSYYTRQTIF